jgi:hypothetical protein
VTDNSLFATLDDINVHLPADKARMQDAQDKYFQIDAYRLIRARLAGIFDPTILASWVDPASTPEIIREISGKIIAAKFYAELVAEDEPDGSLYAQTLYNEALAALQDIRNGTLTVLGLDGIEVANLGSVDASFYPDATAPDPSFTVGEVWG